MFGIGPEVVNTGRVENSVLDRIGEAEAFKAQSSVTSVTNEESAKSALLTD